MKRKKINLLVLLTVVIFLGGSFLETSFIAHAQEMFDSTNPVVGDPTPAPVVGDPTPAPVVRDPSPTNTSLGGGTKIFNPLGEATIYDIAQAILDILMVFAVPIIVFFIIWAGFLYVTAGGKQEQITKATNALLYAVIGGVIVLGANLLLEVITNTFNVFK